MGKKIIKGYIQLPEDYVPEEDNDIVTKKYVDENGGGGSSSEGIILTTHAELLELKNNSQLIPGQKYRITDYVATTSQGGTKSANHPFDLIVTADSEDMLNENARACLHVGDTYFANSNLSEWKIKYSIDNVRNKFYWGNGESFARQYTFMFPGEDTDEMMKAYYIGNITIQGQFYLVFYFDKNLGYLPVIEGVVQNSLYVEDNNGNICNSYSYLVEEIDINQLEKNDSMYIFEVNDNGDSYKMVLIYKGEKNIEGVDYYIFDLDGDNIYIRAPIDQELVSAYIAYEGNGGVEEESLYSEQDLNNENLLPLEQVGVYLYYKNYDSDNSFIQPHESENFVFRGIIYHMVDEYNNECHYDFKGILFENRTTERITDFSYAGGSAPEYIYTFETSSGTGNFYKAGKTYHFPIDVPSGRDATIFSNQNNIPYDNHVEYLLEKNGTNVIWYLPFQLNVFIGNVNGNFIGKNCSGNIIVGNYTRIGDYCTWNIIISANSNFIMNRASNNTIYRGNNVIIGEGSTDNILEKNVSNSKLEENCQSNHIKAPVVLRSGSTWCSIGERSISLIEHGSIVIGEKCSYINIDGKVKNVIIKDNCQYISIDYDYLRNFIVEENCKYLSITKPDDVECSYDTNAIISANYMGRSKVNKTIIRPYNISLSLGITNAYYSPTVRYTQAGAREIVMDIE